MTYQEWLEESITKIENKQEDTPEKALYYKGLKKGLVLALGMAEMFNVNQEIC